MFAVFIFKRRHKINGKTYKGNNTYKVSVEVITEVKRNCSSDNINSLQKLTFLLDKISFKKAS